MKQEMINQLEGFRDAMRALKKAVKTIPGDRVNRKELRSKADYIATQWDEELRSPLEYKFRISKQEIHRMAEQMKKLHVLARPNNLQSSYIKALNSALSKFDNRFILPIKQTAFEESNAVDIRKLIPNLSDSQESEYLEATTKCAELGLYKAAIVMGWCAVVEKIQQRIDQLGLNEFNNASRGMKAEKAGKFKRWTTEFNISSLSDLQELPDGNLIAVLEYLKFFDSNQSERLRTCLQYRNHSAHPGGAPIQKMHLEAFFFDIGEIVFNNPNIKG